MISDQIVAADTGRPVGTAALMRDGLSSLRMEMRQSERPFAIGGGALWIFLELRAAVAEARRSRPPAGSHVAHQGLDVAGGLVIDAPRFRFLDLVQPVQG